MGRVKRTNIDRLCGEKAILLQRAKESGTTAEIAGGVAGGAGQRVQPNMTVKGDRAVIDGPDNAAVIILDNNPRYASEGGDFASRISIVAGLCGHRLKDGDDIPELTPLHDAAGIYVVQKDDPHDFFGQDKDGKPLLVNPAVASIQKEDEGLKTMSHVTAFADIVQIVGRQGVNIYSGGVGKTLSTGVPNREFLGVNLIYGNRIDHDESKKKDYTLQPLVKGKNLEKTLQSILKTQRMLVDGIFSAHLTGMTDKFADSVHVHVPAGPIGGNTPSVDKIVNALISLPSDIMKILKLITKYVNAVITEINMSAASVGGINSLFNKTN